MDTLIFGKVILILLPDRCEQAALAAPTECTYRPPTIQ